MRHMPLKAAICTLAVAALAVGSIGIVAASGWGGPPGPQCRTQFGTVRTAPIAIQATQTWNGTLRATTQVNSGLGQVPNPPDSANVAMGHEQLNLSNGNSVTLAFYSLYSGTSPGSLLSTLYNVVGGTGAYQGATGQLTSSSKFGTSDLRGIYSGSICTP